jgi:hypothetical protein
MIGPAIGLVDALALAQLVGTLGQSRGRIGETPRIIGAPPKQTRVGRNDPCPCGSGRKFKKCHLAMAQGNYVRDPSRRPQPKDLDDAEVQAVAAATTPPSNKNATAIAMLNAKVSERIVWAYLETGIYMTEANRHIHPADTVEKWESALKQYDEATPEERQIMMAPAVPD